MAHARGGVLVAVNIDEESCLQMCRTMPLCLSGKAFFFFSKSMYCERFYCMVLQECQVLRFR